MNKVKTYFRPYNINLSTYLNKVFFALVGVAAVFATSYFNVFLFSVPVRYLSILGLAIILQQIVYRFTHKNNLAISLSVFLFTLFWGIPIFNGYIYYDELTRLPVPPINSWFYTTVNDHYMPAIHALWFIEYNVFSGNYIVISSLFFISALLGLFFYGLFLGELTKNLAETAKIVLIVSASVPFHLWKLWFWKGCGDGPVTSFMFFGLCLWLFARFGRFPSLAQALVILIVYCFTVLSSSAITLGVLCLAVFPICLKEYRNAKSMTLLASCGVVSLIYWILREQFVSSSLNLNNLKSLPSALAGIIYCYAFNNIIVLIVMVAIVLWGLGLALKSKQYQGSLAALGTVIFFLGGVQLAGGRGLVFENRYTYSDYHMHFPFVGLSIWLAHALAMLVQRYGLKKIAFLLLPGAVLISLSVFSVQQKILSEADPVRKERNLFFRDLQNLSGQTVPDLSLANSYRVEQMNWCPPELLKDPAWSHCGWGQIVTIGKLAKFGFVKLMIDRSGKGPISQEWIIFKNKWWGKAECIQER